MSQPRTSTPTRRGVLAAGGAVGLGALLAACGDGGTSGKSGDSGGNGGGSWSFTDDREKKVTLDAVPDRIVAFTGTAAALHDFGIDEQVVGVFGPTKLPNGKADPQAGDLDVDRLEIIGNAYGEFSIEKYAKTRPQVLITNMYEPGALWFVPEESKDKIVKLAPTVAITASRTSLKNVIGRYADLAESLGADLKAQQVTSAKARFEKAAERLRRAAKASGGLKVLACSGSKDLFYASNPGMSADLMFFQELGVQLVTPDNLDEGGYFESLSWENADKYDADLLFLDDRTATLQPEQLKAKPSWRDLPAVKAGQVTPWSSEPRFSYAGSAPLVERLAKAVEDAAKVG
ncbi:ABC transporter substrate-binding protein [Streptomyces sp. DSM 42041]|uniref:ABC transporter substrate-binding protein n=1 Tax=Streptomyces hazeniae TaxID=3075538 RepID=A0ABU2NY27_9ACTN|nr:ABC transporter substrate-binding protein [Streptomyces sp. DSM 42041]MDT0381900.1 ABC transporter substrate-binding protein [Streptomyces sp. DSM 42041]